MRNKRAIFLVTLLSTVMMFGSTCFAASSPKTNTTTQQAAAVVQQSSSSSVSTEAPKADPVYYTSGVNSAGQQFYKVDFYKSNVDGMVYGDPIGSGKQDHQLIFRAQAGTSYLQTGLADRQLVADAFSKANPGASVVTFFVTTADGVMQFKNLAVPAEGKAYYYVGAGIGNLAGQFDTGILQNGTFTAKKGFAYAIIRM